MDFFKYYKKFDLFLINCIFNKMLIPIFIPGTLVKNLYNI